MSINPFYSRQTRAALETWDVEDNSYDDYKHILGLRRAKLGRFVLDLGSGNSELFARYMSAAAHVVTSLNPNLIRPEVRNSSRKSLKGLPKWQGRSVAGLAQQLPFRNGSFDAVVSLAAVPAFLDIIDHNVALREVVRVLRPGGAGISSANI